MKKIMSLLLLAFILALPAWASQRVVVAEDFTGTWCQYCPAAANGLDQLYTEAPDSLVVLAYHYGDVYQTTETLNRIIWYGDMIPGYPTVIFDGLDSIVGSAGSGAAYNNYDYYRPVFDAHKVISSPYEITVEMKSFDLGTKTGVASVKIKNTGVVADSGTLHFALIERAIPEVWQGMTMLDFVVRDMIPDENGETVKIASGDSLILSRNVVINPLWKLANCQYTAFIQRSNKEIVQGAELKCRQSLIQKRYAAAEFGNGNGFYEPAETLKCAVYVQELFADGTGAKVTAWTPDTFVTIQNPVWNIGNIAANDSANNSSDPFRVIVKPNATMNQGHNVTLYLTKQVYNDLYSDTVRQTDSLNFLVGTPVVIYTEGFEAGRSNWADSGIGGGVNWDTTSAAAHTGSVCITDSKAGNYANTQNRYIWMKSPVDLTSLSSAYVSWYEKYDVLANDYCYPEYSTDPLHQATTFSSFTSYNGSTTDWQVRKVDISKYCNSKDFRLRFRLYANNTGVADGWYVDDIAIYGFLKTGVAGRPADTQVALKPVLFNAAPNPFRSRTEIRYQIDTAQKIKLAVYDISGRLVRTLVNGTQFPGLHCANWDGLDERGRQAPNGVYIYSLSARDGSSTKKVVLIK